MGRETAPKSHTGGPHPQRAESAAGCPESAEKRHRLRQRYVQDGEPKLAERSLFRPDRLRAATFLSMAGASAGGNGSRLMRLMLFDADASDGVGSPGWWGGEVAPSDQDTLRCSGVAAAGPPTAKNSAGREIAALNRQPPDKAKCMLAPRPVRANPPNAETPGKKRAHAACKTTVSASCRPSVQ